MCYNQKVLEVTIFFIRTIGDKNKSLSFGKKIRTS